MTDPVKSERNRHVLVVLTEIIPGWVILHPDGAVETDYFNTVNFTAKNGTVVTPSKWMSTHRPNCRLVRAELRIPTIRVHMPKE